MPKGERVMQRVQVTASRKMIYVPVILQWYEELSVLVLNAVIEEGEKREKGSRFLLLKGKEPREIEPSFRQQASEYEGQSCAI